MRNEPPRGASPSRTTMSNQRLMAPKAPGEPRSKWAFQPYCEISASRRTSSGKGGVALSQFW
jgi:hypothetical protein